MIPVRIDDYPYGTPGYKIEGCRADLWTVFGIFESMGVPYIIGVIPMLIEGADIELLNSKLVIGKAVMHGFDHLFARWHDYNPITLSWPIGGEFAGLDRFTIQERYSKCDAIMRAVNAYDPTQFVAPFNTYTQEALDVLSAKGVSKIHTCDKEYDKYKYNLFNYHGITPIISRWQKEYDFAFRLLDRDLMGRQITLHWMYDVRTDPQWVSSYQHLCTKLLKGGA